MTITLDGNGKVTAGLGVSGIPAFRATPAGEQTGLANEAYSKILFATESFDTANCFANSRFTPNVAGYYQINAVVAMSLPSATDANTMTFASLYKNGTEYSRGVRQYSRSIVASNFVDNLVSDVVYCNGTTDYLEIYGYQGNDAPAQWSTEGTVSYFSGVLVRAD